jgi:hypothetical protein
LGYSRSGEKRQLQLLVNLSCWLEAECLDVDAVASPRVELFFAARRAAGYANLLTVRSLDPLLDYLGRIGAVEGVPRPGPVGPNEALVNSFGRYLVSERGLVEGTARFYVHIAGLFIAEHDVESFGELKAADVTGFAARVCNGRGLSLTSGTGSASTMPALTPRRGPPDGKAARMLFSPLRAATLETLIGLLTVSSLRVADGIAICTRARQSRKDPERSSGTDLS